MAAYTIRFSDVNRANTQPRQHAKAGPFSTLISLSLQYPNLSCRGHLLHNTLGTNGWINPGIPRRNSEPIANATEVIIVNTYQRVKGNLPIPYFNPNKMLE